MPRPSLKDQRSAEILDAYLTCVARFGLEGATQERIAAEAGVKRPLLRHYLGNRDEMIMALAAHVIEGFAAVTEALDAALQSVNSAQEMVDLLFADGHENDPRLTLVWQALAASAADQPEMRQQLLDSFARFLDVITQTLRRLAPGSSDLRVQAVTQGVAAALVNFDAMSPLAPPAQWQEELKHAARILAESLDDPK